VEAIYWLIVIIMVIVGVIGIVVPIIPGTALVFFGLLIGAWIDKFEKVGWGTVVVLLALAACASAFDLLGSSVGAKRAGASTWAIGGAAAGTLVGLFFGIPGVLLGPFVGAVLAEYLVRRDIRQAGKAGLGTWLGLVLATAGKIALVFTMIAVFLFAYLF
jgi:uncharacterized protein